MLEVRVLTEVGEEDFVNCVAELFEAHLTLFHDLVHFRDCDRNTTLKIYLSQLSECEPGMGSHLLRFL